MASYIHILAIVEFDQRCSVTWSIWPSARVTYIRHAYIKSGGRLLVVFDQRCSVICNIWPELHVYDMHINSWTRTNIPRGALAWCLTCAWGKQDRGRKSCTYMYVCMYVCMCVCMLHMCVRKARQGPEILHVHVYMYVCFTCVLYLCLRKARQGSENLHIHVCMHVCMLDLCVRAGGQGQGPRHYV